MAAAPPQDSSILAWGPAALEHRFPSAASLSPISRSAGGAGLLSSEPLVGADMSLGLDGNPIWKPILEDVLEADLSWTERLLHESSEKEK